MKIIRIICIYISLDIIFSQIDISDTITDTNILTDYETYTEFSTDNDDINDNNYNNPEKDINDKDNTDDKKDIDSPELDNIIDTGKNTNTEINISDNDNQNNIKDTVHFTYSEENKNRKTLEKYGTIRVPFDDYMISFDSSGFNDGEEMHFKIRAENESYIDEGIYYQYIGANAAFIVDGGKFVKYDIKTDFEIIGSKKYKIKYFTIKKNKNEFRGTNGDLLIIEFYFDYGTIEITNTEEDEGKFETWKIIVIVAAVVVVIGIGVGLYCYRRKKEWAWNFLLSE